jgi:WD40 repeat protein
MTRSRAGVLAVTCLAILSSCGWAEAGAGDELPSGARSRMGTLRFRHGGPVGFLRFAPDGKTVLTAAGDGSFRLWDVASGKELRRLAGGLYGGSLAFSADGRALALVGPDGSLQVREMATWKELRKPFSPPNGVGLVAFSPDGKAVAVLGGDGVLRLGELTAGNQFRALTSPPRPQGGPGPVRGFSPSLITFSPDGKFLAAAGSNGQNAALRLWDIVTGKELWDPADLPGRATCLVFSPDARTLVLGSDNQKPLRILDVTSGKEIRQVAKLAASGSSVAFAPDGRTLSVGNGEHVDLVEVATGRILRQFPAPAQGWHYSVAFAPDGRTLAMGGSDNLVRFWDVATGKELRPTDGHHGPIAAVRLSPDGKILATSSDDRTIRLWEVATGKELRRLVRPEASARYNSAAVLVFAPEGKTVAAAWADGAIAVWDVATGKRTGSLPGSAGAYPIVVFSADGSRLALIGSDGNPRLRDVTTGRELRRFRLQAQADQPVPGQAAPQAAIPVTALALSPDGRTLATGQGAGGWPGYANLGTTGWVQGTPLSVVRLWEVSTGQERGGHLILNRAAGVGYYGGSSGTILFTDLASTYLGPGSAGVSAIRFAPDGRTLVAACDNVLHLWDLTDNREIRRLEGESIVPSAVTFSPDSKLLAVGGIGSFALWETATGKLLAKVPGHQGPITSIAFSGDGNVLATAGADTTALVWDVKAVMAESRRRATERSPRDLQALWQELGSDAARAYAAQRRLVQAPARAVPFLDALLKPVAPVDARRLAQLVAALDDQKFAVRQQAALELEKLGDASEVALHRVLAGKPSLETRKRARDLLGKIEGPVTDPEQLRALRAVEVLERIGTTEARRVLQRLAGGAPEAALTRQAQGGLRRLGSGDVPSAP